MPPINHSALVSQVFTSTLQKRDMSEAEWQVCGGCSGCLSLHDMPQTCEGNILTDVDSCQMSVLYVQKHLNTPSPPFQLIGVEDLVPETMRGKYAELAS